MNYWRVKRGYSGTPRIEWNNYANKNIQPIRTNGCFLATELYGMKEAERWLNIAEVAEIIDVPGNGVMLNEYGRFVRPNYVEIRHGVYVKAEA